VSVLPITETPEPDAAFDVDLSIPPLVQPRPVPDPAIRWRVLIDGDPVTPSTVHVRQRRAAA